MKFRRWLSVLLALCMLATFVPSALMEEANGTNAIEMPVEEVQFDLGDDSIQDLPEVNQEMTFELSTATDDFVDQDSDSIEAQLASGGVAFDAVHFPDPVFRERIRFVDQNGDGFLSTSELNQVTDLEVDGYSGEAIQSIAGIEYFTKLRFLDCRGCSISTLDISKNTALTKLYCSENMLTTLNTTKNTMLEILECDYNRIQTLDIRNNRKLFELNCDGNMLTALDVSNNKELLELSCDDNKLTTLDVSNNSKMEQLSCYNNNLTSLDLSHNSSLWLLSCADNNISELNIRGCTELDQLLCCGNNFKVLDVSECPLMNKLVLHVTPEKYYEDPPYGGTILYEGGKEEADCLMIDEDVTIITRSSDVFLISSNTSKSIYAGESIQIAPKEQTAKSYKASPTSVASVTQSGVVKGLKAGKATITVTLTNKKTLKLTLTVADPTAPSKISINSTDKEIMLGETRQLSTTMTAVKSGYTATSKLTWKSNKSSVLSVDSNGKLTARKAGTATITVTTANKLSDSVTITVIEPSKPKTIVINAPEQEYVPVKGTLQLTVKMTALREPVSAKLTWKSNNTKVAAIDKNGKVTGKSDGTAKITVTTDNKLTASIDIRVRDTHAPTSVKIKPLDVEYLGIKDKAQLTAVMTAIDDPVSKLTWKSLDTKVASVDSKGVVTGKKEGTVTITVTTANKLSASIDVTVKDIHAPTSVSIEPSAIERIFIKEKVQLQAVMTAIGEPKSKLKWQSSDKKIATVDSKGMVTGKAYGQTLVTVTTDNGYAASIVITVDSDKDIHVTDSSLANAFLKDSTTENWIIRYNSIKLATEMYHMHQSSKGIEASLSGLGFGGFEPHYYNDMKFVGNKDHNIAYIFAYIDVTKPDGTLARVFAVICRGTVEGAEWASNFTIGSGLRHYGFDQAAKGVSEAFRAYFENHYNGKEIEYKIWVTGHSRGAAVANLLAGYYFPQLGFPDSRVYGYTFACPLVSKGNLQKRNNVFNYNLGGDLVPRVPFIDWEYKRYGRTCTMKNGLSYGGVDLISTDAMNTFAGYLGSLGNKTLNVLFEEVKDNISSTKGTVSAVPALLMLLEHMFNKVKPLIPNMNSTNNLWKTMFNEVKLGLSTVQVATRIFNTHQPETYLMWMDSLVTGNAKFDN